MIAHQDQPRHRPRFGRRLGSIWASARRMLGCRATPVRPPILRSFSPSQLGPISVRFDPARRQAMFYSVASPGLEARPTVDPLGRPPLPDPVRGGVVRPGSSGGRGRGSVRPEARRGPSPGAGGPGVGGLLVRTGGRQHPRRPDRLRVGPRQPRPPVGRVRGPGRAGGRSPRTTVSATTGPVSAGGTA